MSSSHSVLLLFSCVLLTLTGCSNSGGLEGKWQVFRMKDAKGNVFYSTIPEERKRLDSAQIMPEKTALKYDESFGKIQFLFAGGKSSILDGNKTFGCALKYEVDEQTKEIVTGNLLGEQKTMNYELQKDTLELKFDGLWLVLKRE